MADTFYFNPSSQDNPRKCFRDYFYESLPRAFKHQQHKRQPFWAGLETQQPHVGIHPVGGGMCFSPVPHILLCLLDKVILWHLCKTLYTMEQKSESVHFICAGRRPILSKDQQEMWAQANAGTSGYPTKQPAGLEPSPYSFCYYFPQ